MPNAGKRLTRMAIPRFVFALFCAVVLAHGTQTIFAQGAGTDCLRCKPVQNGANVSGVYTVCIQPETFNSNQLNGITRGGQFWQAYLDDQGHHVVFDFVVRHADSSCHMTISAGSAGGFAALAQGTYNGDGAWIQINSSYLSNNDENRWAELFGHEFGHIVGYSNVDDDYCHGKTLMQRATLMGNLPSLMLCSDAYAVGDKYGWGDSVDDEPEPYPSDSQEDCFDYWQVTHYYALYSDGSYRYLGSTERYLYTDCEPLEDEGNDAHALTLGPLESTASYPE